MTGVLFLSAHELEKQETRSLKNSMKQAAELLEKQYQVMESIALQIGTKIDFRPYRVEQEGGEEPAQEPLPENLDGYPENRIPPPIELYNRCIYAARALTS